LSAHRTPGAVADYVASARSRGIKVLIAAAGGAAHLAGAVAANTTLPVLGVPMTSALQGVDSLYSTVQMPGGVPGGTLALGKAGAVNAALLAAAIVALSDDAVARRLEAHRAELRDKALADDHRLERALRERSPGANFSSALQSAGFKVD